MTASRQHTSVQLSIVRILFVVFLVAVAVRCVAAFFPPVSELLPRPYLRSLQYAEATHNILGDRGPILDQNKLKKIFADWRKSGHRLPDSYRSYPDSADPEYRDFWDEKGYLLLTMGLAKLTGRIELRNVVVLQIALSGLAAVMFAIAVFNLTNSKKYALAAGLLYGLHPLETILSVSPDHPVWQVYAAVAALAALTLRWRSWPGSRTLVVALSFGAFLGFCLVVRGTTLGILASLVIGLLWARQATIANLSGLLAGVIVVVLIAGALPPKYKTIGRPGVSHTLLAGLSEFGAIDGLSWNDNVIDSYITQRYDVYPMTPEFEEAYTREYKRVISERPWLLVTVPLQRLSTFVVAWRPGKNAPIVVALLAVFKVMVLWGATIIWLRLRQEGRARLVEASALVIFTPILLHALIVPLGLIYTAPSAVLATPLALLGAVSAYRMIRRLPNASLQK